MMRTTDRAMVKCAYCGGTGKRLVVAPPPQAGTVPFDALIFPVDMTVDEREAIGRAVNPDVPFDVPVDDLHDALERLGLAIRRRPQAGRVVSGVEVDDLRRDARLLYERFSPYLEDDNDWYRDGQFDGKDAGWIAEFAGVVALVLDAHGPEGTRTAVGGTEGVDLTGITPESVQKLRKYISGLETLAYVHGMLSAVPDPELVGVMSGLDRMSASLGLAGDREGER